jgi:transmembrane sensor
MHDDTVSRDPSVLLPLDVLDRWVAGTPTEDDQMQIAAYAARGPGAASLIHAVGGDDITAWPAHNVAHNAVRQRVLAHECIEKIEPPRGMGRRTQTRWWSGALAAFVVSVAAIVMIYRATTANAPAQTTRVYATPMGQRATVHLADGSTVTLAPGTQLSVSQPFGHSARTVTLEGEAYFDVTNTVGLPFIVQTGNVTTHVLGTTFDVKHYATDHTVRIVVASGKVQSGARFANPDQHPVTLTAGMIGHVTDSTATVTTRGDVSVYVGWTQGRLDFRETPMPDVLATMERWYGLRFQLADSTLLRETVTGSLDFHTTAAALRCLKSLLDVPMTVVRHGDTTMVTLHARVARTSPVRTRRDWQLLKPQMEVGR